MIEARGMVRNGAGKAFRLSATGKTQKQALDRLMNKADAVWEGMFVNISPDSTVAEVVELWLADVEERGDIQQSTKESYAQVGRGKITEYIGAVPIRRVDAGLCHALLKKMRRNHTISYARNVRRVMSVLLKFAVVHRALERNPLPDTPRMHDPEPHYIEWDFEQVDMMLRLLKQWTGVNPERRGGGVPDVDLVIDLILIMLGTSLRPAEALGIRRQDVTFLGDRALLNLQGTVSTTKKHGTIWKSTPKRKSQQRAITVPAFAAEVLRRRMANYRHNEHALLFPTRTGKPRGTHNVNRMLRSFRAAHAEILLGIGVEPSDVTCRAFRKMAAMTIADHAGMDLAASLLGHADSKTTRDHYAKPNRVVPSQTADILERQFPFTSF
ncbi:tyrosine-type recombinase/integrase [Microbacterium natoriense]|nr:tyrosine-type recombinase/integrase [Microbacterium natoriense]